MKIENLVIEGFGPFRDRQQVDLDRYAADGIFLISGRTGTGKSSILDAICFALYGTTPRASDGEKRFRSDYSEGGDPTSVTLDFTVGPDGWRIVRAPEYERPKKTGAGTTTAKSSVELFRREGDGWIGVAAKEREVGQRVRDIVGMSSDQFQQVILLAQGRFAKFLLAKNDDRQKLLRSLFGTRRFEQYEQALDERRKKAEAGIRNQRIGLNAILDEAGRLVAEVRDAVATSEATSSHEGSEPTASDGAFPGDGESAARDAVAAGAADSVRDGTAAESAALPGDAAHSASALRAVPAEDDTPGRIAQTETAHEVAVARVATAQALVAESDAARARAEKVRDDTRKLADDQRRRDAARATLGELDARADEISVARSALDAARRAETVRTAIDGVSRAETDEARTRGAAEQAREEWSRAREEAAAREASEAHADANDAAGPPARAAAVSDASGIPPADAAPAALDAFADDLKRRIGAWEPLRTRESELSRDAERLAGQRMRLSERDDAIAELAAKEASLPDRIRAAQKQRDEAGKAADRAEQIDDHIRALEAQIAAAQKAVRLADAYATADAALDSAKAARDAAEHTLDELHRRRLAGYSSELAQKLVLGEPCTVCGSVEHPAPAIGGDHVTPETMDEADAVRIAAVDAHERAVAARQQAELDLRDAETRAGGRTATEVDGDLLTARQDRAAAETGRKQKAALEREIVALEAERERAAVDYRDQVQARAQLDAEITGAANALAEATADVEAARGAFASVAERIGAAQRLASHAAGCSDAHSEHVRAAAALTTARAALNAALESASFADATDATAAQRTPDEIAALDKTVSTADTRRATAQATLDELAGSDIPDEPVVLDAVEAVLAGARAARDAAVEARGAAEQLRTALAGSLERAKAAHDEIRERAEEVAVIVRLADTVAGRAPNMRRMNLETFVLAAELEEIVQAANVRLAEMSDNRYTLRHSDSLAKRNAASGLGIEVFDAYSGRARSPHSLSGGETFLASLALALGLAEVVTNRSGGIRLDTLFIDEGFGSLDAETLETAMRTLDDLRQGGRTVGLISHVEAMKEQIPAQLRVRRAPGGWSIVEQ